MTKTRKTQILLAALPAAALGVSFPASAMHIMEGYLPAGFCVAWADEIFLFKDGSVLKSGTPEEVFTDTSALRETNLTQPAVLELFDSLCAKGILEKEDIKVIFPNLNGINIKDICEMQCYKTLAEIKSVIEDDTLEDRECFWKIEKIISIFE